MHTVAILFVLYLAVRLKAVNKAMDFVFANDAIIIMELLELLMMALKSLH